MSGAAPPHWSDDRLEQDRRRGIEQFRTERVDEPLDVYLGHYSRARSWIDSILRLTADLTRLRERATVVMGTPELADMARYLSSPPLSRDDLETLAGVSMAASKARTDVHRATRLIDTIMLGLDRQRFGWVAENRPPTEAERESAATATAAMRAMRMTETQRRGAGKTMENTVKQFLRGACGIDEVGRHSITTGRDWPAPGTFFGECEVYGRKADIVVGLWDGRLLLIECKVTGSSTNSVKRVLNDAGAKAGEWKRLGGAQQCIPAAMLSGVISLVTLKAAQQTGLTLFWAHSLNELRAFTDATRP